MNLTVDEITKSITGKHSLYECGADELKQLANQYPFFGPAKFLLAKKLREEKSPLLEDHIRKASLYFQNPVWFDHLLNDTGSAIENHFAQKNTEVELGRSATFEKENFEQPVLHQSSAAQVQEEPQSAKAGIEGDFDDEETSPADDEPTVALPPFKFEPIADPSKAELTFEPYHTIDYFASQGIKAKEDEKSEDKFGRQLKSFTEWLKILKKTPVSEIGGSVNPVEEQKVEKLAETSINDREVVTEAMAEVWEKQGNATKASEVYRKLSLLNPSKSSYFAAKIEQLKNL